MRLIKLLTFFVLTTLTASVCAQNWYRVNRHYERYGYKWSFPYSTENISYFDFSKDDTTVTAHQVGSEEEEIEIAIPFRISDVNSITFEDETPEEGQTHDKYKVFAMNITTENSVGVNSKEEYVNCFVSLDGGGEYDDFSGSARIRGRGNSTWEWYEKKPYRIKLDKKHKLLGLGKNKDWVLLANFRDPTDLMNTFVFEVADWMGMKYVNNTRYVEVFLDGDYKGLYQLTEQVEQGEHRVEVSDDGGILLGIDADDGPSLSPDTGDNFWSPVFSMPICVKYPKDPSSEQVDSIKNLMKPLETAIKNADYDALDQLMDMKSFMTMAMLQEYVENVELCAPRSVFMYKDKDGKWFMGPFWDWDAGFDFDWGYMTAGHRFFLDYRELILGSDPGQRKGMYGGTPKFFTNMFNNDRYTKEYKALWNSVKDSIFTRNWEVMEKFIANLDAGPYERDYRRWPITDTGDKYGKEIEVTEEIEKMKTWLQKRTEYLDKIINAYPEGRGDTQTDVGVISSSVSGNVITINAIMSKKDGYSQDFHIDIDKSLVAELFELTENELDRANVNLVPLNSNGTEGRNTAAGLYGAWFTSNGDTGDWGWGHVYIESNELWSWACGCHPDNCRSNDKHTVSMQYKLKVNNSTSKKVTVKVNFGIDVKP